jgi:L-ribulose-5-phosphate 3-epimerase
LQNFQRGARLKKSISTWSFPGDWALERKLKVAAEAGFEGFEIDLSESGDLTVQSTGDDVNRVLELCKTHKLELSGLATGLYWGSNPASGDPNIIAKASGILKAQIILASQLGIDTVLVVPGSVGADFIHGMEIIPYDKAWERARTFVAEHLALAEKHRVRMGIENVWNKFLTSPREMKEFIDQFKSDWVVSYFDTGNVLAQGYPEHWISILGQRVGRVHFKDYRRNVGTVDGFCDLLSGDTNWPEVMRSLRAIGYNGWIAAEMIPPVPFYKHAPEVLIHNTSRAMDAIFDLG